MEKFRTEIDIRPDKEHRIDHSDGIVMLGSCFTDNVGALLRRDGFNVTFNPFGPLYNPASIENVITRALLDISYSTSSFVQDEQGLWHCLDFASKYVSNEPEHLASHINTQLQELRDKLLNASTVIITLGTAFVYYWKDIATSKEKAGQVYAIGNCHKFPAHCFNRERLGVADVRSLLTNISALLLGKVRNIIFTVSPIRHIGDGLHGNQLSKATLLLGIDQAMNARIQPDERMCYFPSYEIMLDDLRDYRFYAADMKHPSDVAIDYIYERFLTTFCTKETIAQAEEARRLSLRQAHRPLEKL